ncbi:hypothetical protein K443DRAFT_673561 [Laccaria amethystina LaAM-08-1]|uniref:Uncharacterized protein n=1 Tax=Laccaria amethystina LaAM-08-1 TaxID=1095629 RepID=A0A0C9YGZ6_9AGAR|nr:hypothetical protein K443DRAFT_673561 [Laccaria amethystina LaAM-08-1]
MDFRSQGVVVNAVGFLYASVGFFLSVLGAILNAFYRHNAPPLLAAAKNSHRKAQLDPSLPRRNQPPCTEAEPALRSQSIVPDITLDQHLDNQSTTATTTTTFLLISSSQSTTDHGSTRRPFDEPSSNDMRRLIDVDNTRVGFRMSNLKPPWVKEKPRISRSRSSPQLSNQLSSPSCRQKKSKVKKDKRGPESLEEKPEKALRKVCSTPGLGGEKVTMKTFTQNAVKKRTETLRTQPYEAPYFCAPPIPLAKPRKIDVKPISKSRSMTFAV